ncbi:hypothetical protein ACED90_10885 [Rothia sp. 11254D007CT]
MPTITLYTTPDSTPENGEHIEVGLTDGGFIHPQVARAIAGTTAERICPDRDQSGAVASALVLVGCLGC